MKGHYWETHGTLKPIGRKLSRRMIRCGYITKMNRKNRDTGSTKRKVTPNTTEAGKRGKRPSNSQAEDGRGNGDTLSLELMDRLYRGRRPRISY